MSEKKIGNRTFKVDKLLATQALLLQARVFKILGPGIAKMSEILRNRDDHSGMNAAALAALADVLAATEPEALTVLLKDLVQIAKIKRPSGSYDPCDLDGDFTEYPQDIYPVVLFVLREQLGDFFTALPVIGNLAKAGKA